MAIYLIRHGESEGNRQKVFQGSLPFRLTELGVRQAHACGAWLAGQGVEPTHVFCSPMRRARQTAEIISARLGGPAPADIEDLREINAGRLQGLTEPEARQRFPDYANSNKLPPQEANSWGGETSSQLGARARRFRELIEAQHAAHDVLAVSHGGLLGELVKQWCGWPAPQRSFIRWSNCCCLELRLRELSGRMAGELQWMVPLQISAPELAATLTAPP